MQNKKILITLATVCIALVTCVAALVIVLVSGGQSAKSTVTVKFVATDVACEVQAAYSLPDMKLNDSINQTYQTFGGKLVIDETVSSGAMTSTGEIALSKEFKRVVFQYAFTNTMTSTPMYVELKDLPDNETEGEVIKNVNLKYYNSYHSLAKLQDIEGNFMGARALFCGYYDDQLESELHKVVVLPQTTKYIYIVVTIDQLTENASFEGEIEWNLTRGAVVESSYDNGKLIMLNVYEGCEVTEADLNHSTVNIRSLGWYTDSDLTNKVEFPYIVEEGTFLYCDYLMGNIAEENLYVYSSNKALSVGGPLVIGATSTVDGYTPVTSSDTTLVIPDMFELSDGRILPITEIQQCYDESIDIGILTNNQHITTVYIGNNCTIVGRFSDSTSVLEDIYLGKGVMLIATFNMNVQDNLKNVYIDEGCGGNNWVNMASEFFVSEVSETVFESGSSILSYLKGMDFNAPNWIVKFGTREANIPSYA